MKKININATQKVVPMVYAYTTPEIARHNGWTKIGYTEKQSVENRIKQQTHTSDTEWKLKWKKTAVYDDGSGDTFTDHEFHAYLQKINVERKINTEWFKITGAQSKEKIIDFKENRGVLYAKGTAVPYQLRNEQDTFVTETKYIDWFNRMCDYGFIENIDYLLVSQKRETNNPKNPWTDYIDHSISIDMAKEICMIQRSEKGKEFRQYFVENINDWKVNS